MKETLEFYDEKTFKITSYLEVQSGTYDLTGKVDNEYALWISIESDNGEISCAELETGEEAKDDTVTVYSGDLIPEDPETVPANQNIPIAKLAPKQALRFEAYAQLGKGKEHAKWSPVSVCVYQNT